jgi:hypothetical protein
MNAATWKIVCVFNAGIFPQIAQSSKGLIYPSNLFFFWLITGVLLSIAEFFVLQKQEKRYRYIALSMAIPAWIVAFGLLLNRVVVNFNLQILCWMGMSVIAALWGRSILLNPETGGDDRS